MRKRHFKRWCAITDPSFGPLGGYLDKFRDELSRRGYKQQTIDARIRIARHLNRWFYQNKLCAKDLDEKAIRKFLMYHNKYHANSFKRYRSPLRELLNWLREQNIVPKPVICEGKYDYILNEYVQYLKYERGLSEATVKSYVFWIHCFLFRRFQKSEIL